jgi:hypothetical protein
MSLRGVRVDKIFFINIPENNPDANEIIDWARYDYEFINLG